MIHLKKIKPDRMLAKDAIKTVLITGASSGIGRSLALIFAEDPAYHLVLTGRNVERLNQVAQSCFKKNGLLPTVITADLSRASQVDELVTNITARDLHIDILVNNAGFGYYGDFDHINQDELLQMMHVNMVALTQLTYLFLPGMKAKNTGQIIFIGSVYSYISVPHQALYAATKAFVKSFALGLREELVNTEVLVSCVCPGSTHTNFHKRSGITAFSSFLSTTPERLAQLIKQNLAKNYGVMIPGWYNRCFVFLTNLLPSHWIVKIVTLFVYRLRKFRLFN